MELVYRVNKCSKQRRDWAPEDSPICALSPKNVIAFTNSMDLVNSNGDAAQTFELSFYVYVCDIDKPWDVYKVTCLEERVVTLNWDVSGTKLLITDAQGVCEIWHMKDYMMNDWQCSHSASIPGEHIIAASWLHQGIVVNFIADKKDSALYVDKIVRKRFAPSLCQFGGKAVEGFIAITTTGLITVGLPKTGSQEVTMRHHSIGPLRSRIQIADIGHDSNGEILIATSDGTISSVIQCYRVSVLPEPGACKIKCRPTASFYAKCHLEMSIRDSPSARVTHVQYLDKQCGEILLIGAGDTNVSHVEKWKLTEQKLGLHRLYQSNASSESSYQTLKWVHTASVSHNSLPVAVAIPRFPVVQPMPDTSASFFQYIAVAYKDGSMKLIRKANFQPMATMNLDTGILESDHMETKRRKVPQQMVHMQQTYMGSALVGMDQDDCIYVMKASNTRDPVTQISPVYLVSLLEYCMVTGYDWWDIILALKPGMVESVIQKLTDNYMKQPPATQELRHIRFMAVKASLYRASSCGQQRVADCLARLLLNSVAVCFKSVLRPKSMTGQDKSPADKLAFTCSKSIENDIDKVMMTLNPEKKEFVVDPSTLQALQQLIQWVSDLTLYLLASIPMSQGYGSFPGSTIIYDIRVLSTLRELLVIIRIWGLINPSCLPHFSATSANFDCLSQLFKLLTKLWLSCQEGSGMDLEETFIDECCLLPSQVFIPDVNKSLLGDLNIGGSIFQQNHPLKYTFGEEPDHETLAMSNGISDGQGSSGQKRDIVRHIYLGVNPSEATKKCSRCGCMSLLKSVVRFSALKSWDMCWARACVCGGHWAMVDSK